jgi:hypothetical protein
MDLATITGDMIDQWCIKANAQPFAWGHWDCVLMAADWVQTVTGVDIAADWRGNYTTEHEAYSVIGDNFGTLEGVAGHYIQTSHPTRLRRGDVVICNYKDGPLTLGVYFGEVTYLTTERGSRPFPTRALAIKGSWRPCLKQ